MPKSRNQKLKLLYIKEILEKYSDENNKLSVKDIIDKLSFYGINAERKSIYDDIEYLMYFGVDIIIEKTDCNRYFIGERTFELPELKLLVDSVQSSKFLTVKKSNSLIKKLESLCSEKQGATLQRQVFVSNRIKNMNESIYITIDEIHNAILKNSKITFKYITYSIDGKQIYRNNGEKYKISPFALLLEDENYYLIGFDSEKQYFKHFRVDKIVEIKTIEEKRDGENEFKTIDLGKYSKKFFSMFGGEEQLIKLRVDRELIGVIIDRFGKNIYITNKTEKEFDINVEIAVSPQFYGWVASFSGKIKIISPENVSQNFKEYLKNIIKTI